jgi:hypothetical protein
MAKKTLDRCKTGQDVAALARRSGYQVDVGGKHPYVVRPDGQRCIAIPTKGKLPDHQRKYLMRQLRAIGMTVLIVGVPVAMLMVSGVDQEKAQMLADLIVKIVELIGGEVGGVMAEALDVGDGEGE